MIRRCAPVLVVACAILAALPRDSAAQNAGPQRPVEIRGIAVGFAGNYKLGVWTPVEIELRGGKEPLSGQIELTLPDGDGVLSRVARPIQVPRERTIKTLLYARFGQSQGTLDVRFVAAGKKLAERSYQTGLEADDRHILYPMDSAAELIVSVGPSIGISSSIGTIADTNEPARRVARLADAGSLPTRWYGYEGVDRLVIATSQPDLLGPITSTSARSEALYDWVRLGGRVVMCVGREGSSLLGKETPLARLAPGKFDRMETLRRVSPLESYAEASTPLTTTRRQLQLDVPRLDHVRGAIVAHEGVQAESLPLVIRAAVGFGHVVFVAVDLDQPPFAAWTSRSQLVDKLLDRPASRPAPGGAQAAGQVASLGYQDIAGQLRAALDRFLGVSLIPFWAVVLLVVAYIVLIGPGDFWLVKKVFRRMEATWITFPLWVILVSVGAYAAAYALKGRELRTNQVELVDVDIESQLVRGSAWINLLSPRPDSYDISYRARPPGDMQLAAPPEQLVAWFGLPGSALGAMNGGGGQTSLFQRPYLFSTQLDAMLGVPIQVWSTKSITTRWHGQAESLLEADLTETVDQMLSGTITNRLGIDLADARLLYDRWAYPIPRLAVGAQLQVSDELRPLTTRTLYTQASIQGKEEILNFYDPASTDVPWILERMLIHEAIGGSGYTAGLTNRFQQFCDLSQHLTEGKAVLIVRAPAGGSDLLLGGEPVIGEHDQRWTIYRFVFPVHKARGAVIETKDLTKKYGDLFAIKQLDIQLDKGDVFGFIGPNGAGKTTTMRILATLLNPTWGEAYVCGYSIYTKPKEIRRVIGYMPDFFGVYDDMKVIEYLEFFAAAYRIKGPQRRKICDEVLELVDLGYKREALVTSLSRGMTQRLGLARVLLHDPQVLLLDEPASGLDPRARIEIRGVIKELRKMGKTIMVSSHILPELADICNKIGIIERGELLVNADVADVMRQVRQQTMLNIRVADDLEGAAKVLESHPSVEKLELRDGLIIATLKPGVEDYSDLANLLVCERGYKLTLFKEDELNLETAFMALTKGITS